MCLARSQNVLLVRRQHVEGRVARSRNGFVEDLSPPGRDLSNVRVSAGPNATDKTLLHDGAVLGENLRDGVCMNDLYIIHLKSVPDADVGQVPAGWTQVFHETVAGTGYTTFYMLTPH